MDLVTAFESLGFLTATDPGASQVRSEAARVVLAELERLAALERLYGEHKDEVVQTVLIRLLAPGGHCETREHRRTEAVVRSYLRRAVQRARIDQGRADTKAVRRRIPDREDGTSAVDTVADDQPSPSSELERAEDLRERSQRLEVLLDALHGLTERAASAIRARRHREAFTVSVHQRLAIFREQSSIEQLVAAEAAPGESPHKARERMYKRHSRALGRLLDQLSFEVQRGQTSPERATELRLLIAALRLKAEGVGSLERGSSMDQPTRSSEV